VLVDRRATRRAAPERTGEWATLLLSGPLRRAGTPVQRRSASQRGCGRPNDPENDYRSAFPLVRAYVEPPPESNRRRHPYHGSAAERRANRRLRRWRDTVRAAVMGPVACCRPRATRQACQLTSLLACWSEATRATMLPVRARRAATASGHRSPPPARSSGTS
jgi:hypothetical protein